VTVFLRDRKGFIQELLLETDSDETGSSAKQYIPKKYKCFGKKFTNSATQLAVHTI
jgi:hypothetical protein